MPPGYEGDFEPQPAYPPAPLAAPRPSGSGRGPVVAVALAVVLLGAAGAVLALSRVGDEHQVSVAGTVSGTFAPAGCAGPAVDAEVIPEASKHREGTIEYETAPAYGGEHNPLPLPRAQQVYQRGMGPDLVERAVHNLEHAYVVVWYDTEASQEDVDRVAGEVRATRYDKVIMVPWDRGTFADTRFALSAWGHLRYCEQPDAASITAFYEEHGGSYGDAPEKLAP